MKFFYFNFLVYFSAKDWYSLLVKKDYSIYSQNTSTKEHISKETHQHRALLCKFFERDMLISTKGPVMQIFRRDLLKKRTATFSSSHQGLHHHILLSLNISNKSRRVSCQTRKYLKVVRILILIP